MTRLRSLSLACLVAMALASSAAPAASQSTTLDAGGLGRIDAIVEAPIKEGKIAGATISIERGGKMLVQKGYGVADREWNVPMPADASFEIGSVTKQFTAASVLLLAERGKLSIDDEITKFLPGFDTHGKRITIRHLLTHTSGIPGYTELPEFRELSFEKKPRDTMLSLLGGKPLDFAPGEALVYDNSGFFLLGLIIEKTSGLSYEEFVRSNLFEKAGMRHSYYCSESAVHPRHAHGYDTAKDGLVLKGYIDHTWPYAAGSLCSTAGDLSAWLRALHGGKILSAESYRAMTTGATLADGTRTRYGFGIAVADIDGRRAIAHGGVINGFLASTAYYPDDDLSVVVLLNTAGPVNPSTISRDIVTALLGAGPDRAQTFSGDLHRFAGTYEGIGRGRRTRLEIKVDERGLVATNRAAPSPSGRELKYLGDDTFGYDDVRLTFEAGDAAPARVRLDAVTLDVVLTRQH